MNNKEIQEFLDILEEQGFNKYQMKVVKFGFFEGLTLEQVKVYADTKFNHSQMFEIEDGLYNGLTIEQVSVYAKPEFEYWQMRNIREDFENGKSIEEIKEKYYIKDISKKKGKQIGFTKSSNDISPFSSKEDKDMKNTMKM